MQQTATVERKAEFNPRDSNPKGHIFKRSVSLGWLQSVQPSP